MISLGYGRLRVREFVPGLCLRWAFYRRAGQNEIGGQSMQNGSIMRAEAGVARMFGNTGGGNLVPMAIRGRFRHAVSGRYQSRRAPQGVIWRNMIAHRPVDRPPKQSSRASTVGN